MDKFFTTYFSGGYVGIHEIAYVLLEATTGLDLFQAEIAATLRASSTPDELTEGLETLAESDSPFDKSIVELLASKPIDEDMLSYYRYQLEQWIDSIEQAAKVGSWTRLDLRSLAPVSPGADANYCVNVRDVIAWLGSIGHSPKLGEVLAEMLDASRRRNGDEDGEAAINKQWGDHDTILLRKFREAYWHWWDGLDLSKDAAPTNEQVQDWLVDHQGVSSRMALYMASILRADGLPKGRPPRVK